MASRLYLHSTNETIASTKSASFDLLFYTSMSINICVLFYFLLFYAANQIVECFCRISTTGKAAKMKNAHRNLNYRTFMYNIYFESFLHTLIMCATTVLILDTHAMNTPFQINRSYSLHILYSCIAGAYMFIFFKELIVAKSGPNKFMNLIVYGVSMAILATVVVTKEDVVIVGILVISNGDVLNVNAALLMKKVLGLKGTTGYRVAIFMGTYATVVFKALLPVGLIVLALINGKPFNMSYPSVFFFFVGLLFFGALNTWQVNAALARICRKNGRVIEVQSREVHALPKPEEREIQERIELPPTYDEVCGAGDGDFPTLTNVSETGDKDVTKDLASDSKSECFSRSEISAGQSDSDSAFGSTGEITNIERQTSFDNGGFIEQEKSADFFLDIDLGLIAGSLV